MTIPRPATTTPHEKDACTASGSTLSRSPRRLHRLTACQGLAFLSFFHITTPACRAILLVDIVTRATVLHRSARVIHRSARYPISVSPKLGPRAETLADAVCPQPRLVQEDHLITYSPLQVRHLLGYLLRRLFYRPLLVLLVAKTLKVSLRA